MDHEEISLEPTEGTQIQRVEQPRAESPIERIAQLMSQPGSNIDTAAMEKMLDMQERHDANEARKAYHEAMAQFHAESPKIIKQKDGHNNKYAGLADIVAVIAPLESEHGLSHSWVTGTSDGEVRVICKITHILGHSEETELSAGPDTTGNKNAIQALGSTITYLQRYTLKAALGLAEAEQDDDGNAADQNQPPAVKPPTDEEWGYIDQICEAMGAPEGMRVDRQRIASVCFERSQAYPYRQEAVATVTKWFGEMNLPEMHIPDTRSEFEKEHDLPGDEDSKPDGEADEALGRFRCTECGHTYNVPLKVIQCPACQAFGVIDSECATEGEVPFGSGE